MSQQCSWQTRSRPLEGLCLYYALLGLSQAPGFAGGHDCPDLWMPAGAAGTSQQNTDQAGAALVDDPLEGLLHFGAGFLGHMQQLGLQPLADQLVQAFAEDVGLPQLDGVVGKAGQQALDQFFTLAL